MRSLLFSNYRAKNVVGKVYFAHGDKISSSSAFEISEASLVRILLPRLLGVVFASVRIFSESLDREVSRYDCVWTDSKGELDVYEAYINTELLGVGLYFFMIELDTQHGRLYGYRCADKLIFSDEYKLNSLYQLSISDFKYKKSEKKLGGIIYHVFVDRFNRGGTAKIKPGVIMDDDWRVIPEYPAYPGAPLKNNHFYGGTLWGIADKLDYIASLGVDTLYLSPIFDAASNHKYDTGNYMAVDSMFGGDEAFVNLIEKAKEKGIGIILDGVFNHTGSDSIYFNREGNYDSKGAYQSPMSEYFSWYDFQSYPDKYTCWWGIDILPRIHPDKAACRKYFVGKDGVIEKYARMGIDGFRLDVADELSDEFIALIKKKLNQYNKSSVLYGEVWEDGSNKIAYDVRKKYYLGSELDGVMNYPVREGIIEFFTTHNTSALLYALTDIIDNAPSRIRNMQMNLLGTHDTERILTVLGGEHSDGRSNEYLSRKKMNDLERGTAKRRLRMAYTVLATIPGIPTIFYGDEAGLEGYHDPFNRMPYPWGREDNNLINYYRQIGRIRLENDVYKEGEFRLLDIDENTLVFERYDEEYSYITFVNNSTQNKKVEFSLSATALCWDGGEYENTTFELPAYTAQIFKVKRNNYIYF